MILMLNFDKGEPVLSSGSGDFVELLDITDDFRTRLINKKTMTEERFRVKKSNEFVVYQDFFVKMAKIQNRETIEVLRIRYRDSVIYILSSKNKLFLNGVYVQPETFELPVGESEAVSVANMVFG